VPGVLKKLNIYIVNYLEKYSQSLLMQNIVINRGHKFYISCVNRHIPKQL